MKTIKNTKTIIKIEKKTDKPENKPESKTLKKNNEEYEITKTNYEIISKLQPLIFEKKINIIGKGYTAQHIKNNAKTYSIGINQGIIFTETKDILFLNDFETVFGLEKYFENIKYIFCPYYPHYNCWVYDNITYKNILNYAKLYKFKGQMFVYQIQTSLNKNILQNFFLESKTTSDIPLQILLKYFKIKNLNFYGVCISDVLNYHPDITNLINKTKVIKKFINDFNKIKNLHITPLYNNEVILILKNHIVSICDKYNIQYNFN